MGYPLSNGAYQKYGRNNYVKNREHILSNRKSKRIAEPGFKKMQTDSCKKWRLANLEKVRNDQIVLRKRHIQSGLCGNCTEKLMENSKTVCIKHYFAGVAGKIGLKTKDWEKLKHILESQNHICPYTGKKLTPGVNASVDHILPSSRFPELKSDLSNIEWVDLKVNEVKSDFTRAEFIEICKLVATRKITNE